MKLGLNVGDHVTFRVDDKEYQAPITGITENYAYHYIHMPPAVYEQVFGEPVTYTNAFAIVPDLDDTVKVKLQTIYWNAMILWHYLITIPS